jgi:hypothetical protein
MQSVALARTQPVVAAAIAMRVVALSAPMQLPHTRDIDMTHRLLSAAQAHPFSPASSAKSLSERFRVACWPIFRQSHARRGVIAMQPCGRTIIQKLHDKSQQSFDILESV